MNKPLPQLPEGPFRITLTCARCQDTVVLTTTKYDIHSMLHTCPSCHRWFVIDPHLDTWTPWVWALFAETYLNLPQS